MIGWLTDIEETVIMQLSKTVPSDGTIVEVGSFCGKSSVAWAKGNPYSTVHCFDLFLNEYKNIHAISDEICELHGFPKNGQIIDIEKEFLNNTANLKNIKHIKGISPYNIQYIGNPIDLFFIDASHTNPNDWDNIEYFSKYLKPKSKICGHDFSLQFPDVIENVIRLEKIHNTKVNVFPNTTLWVIDINQTTEFIF